MRCRNTCTFRKSVGELWKHKAGVDNYQPRHTPNIENADSAVGGEKYKTRTDADDGYIPETDDHKTTETTEVPRLCIVGEQLGKRLPARHY